MNFDKKGNNKYRLMINPINQLVATKGPPHLPANEYNPVILKIISLKPRLEKAVAIDPVSI